MDATIPEAFRPLPAGGERSRHRPRAAPAAARPLARQHGGVHDHRRGPDTALPHHETGPRRLEAGEVALLDFGTRGAGGYHSDITVVCSAGEPADPEVRKVYGVVYDAQQAALAAVRPGATCESIDRAARSVIERAGYGEFFLHRTGHGLGLQVHEPPFLVAGNVEPLAEGMVFSIEPGIYLPGRFGIRLEVIADRDRRTAPASSTRPAPGVAGRGVDALAQRPAPPPVALRRFAGVRRTPFLTRVRLQRRNGVVLTPAKPQSATRIHVTPRDTPALIG